MKNCACSCRDKGVSALSGIPREIAGLKSIENVSTLGLFDSHIQPTQKCSEKELFYRPFVSLHVIIIVSVFFLRKKWTIDGQVGEKTVVGVETNHVTAQQKCLPAS
jgi:hypothetical protein